MQVKLRFFLSQIVVEPRCLFSYCSDWTWFCSMKNDEENLLAKQNNDQRLWCSQRGSYFPNNSGGLSVVHSQVKIQNIQYVGHLESRVRIVEQWVPKSSQLTAWEPTRTLNHQETGWQPIVGVLKLGFLVIRIKPLLIGWNSLLFLIIISPENKTA